MANIPRYLQIYIPSNPHWGGRGRRFKSCHSDQKSIANITFSNAFFVLVTQFLRGATHFATQLWVSEALKKIMRSNHETKKDHH
jgi:hypothetical protein